STAEACGRNLGGPDRSMVGCRSSYGSGLRSMQAHFHLNRFLFAGKSFEVGIFKAIHEYVGITI
ncbi:hypothetical protein, partial [Vibrio diabolicus]|uniref:hypothetical protein n=1 Tax=Vibrio diabolicus TaxID=50719 RepID=UPI00211B5F83